MRLSVLIISAIFALPLSACNPKETRTENTAVKQSQYFLPADNRVTVDGVDIRYRDEGPKEAPVIVMVHGFTSSLETWDALADNLKSEYRIIRLDLPGHGLSGTDPSADYSNARTVTLFQKFLNEVNIDDVTVVGNSLGGLVAWRTAIEDSETINKLVLLSPGGFSINGVTETPVDVPMMVKFYLTKAPSAGVKQASTALYGDPAKLTETRLTVIEDMMKQPGNGEAFVARAAQFTLPAPKADLEKVTQSTLIIWGDKDIMVPPDQGPNFAAAMPNAVLKTYEGVGHVPQEETPSVLATDIRDFLEDKAAP